MKSETYRGKSIQVHNLHAKLLFVVILIWKKWRMKHTGEKAFKCTLCKTAFCCNSSLNENEEWYTQGKKAFKCTLCKTAFCLISIWKKMKSETYRRKNIQVYTLQNCLLLCCNFILKENEKWNIHGQKHSSAHSAKLLIFVISI